MSYFTDFFKLLSDETRFRIIILLAQDELCVCEICGVLELTQPRVSKVLSKLKDMKIVVTKRRERFIFYSLNLNDKTIQKIVKVILTNLAESKQLSKDSKGLANKKEYLNQCKTKPRALE